MNRIAELPIHKDADIPRKYVMRLVEKSSLTRNMRHWLYCTILEISNLLGNAISQ